MGKEVLDELQLAMAFLNKITPPNEKNALSDFKEAFYSRYESREVPLMEALDPELGLGYPVNNIRNDPSPLIDDLIFPPSKEHESFVQYPFQTILHQKAMACITQQKDEIVLTDEDVKNFTLQWNDLPPTLYTVLQIIRANPRDILIKLNFFCGSSGANLLARFAHTDPRILNYVKEIADKEQSLMSDAIIADIVHLPESRIGNIVCRPHVRDYEILYLATSDIPKDQLFDAADLFLSIQKGELIIRSKELQKRIIPRLTSAHNFYNNTLSVYRFLCDMQIPVGRKSINFTWSNFDYPFRPRVRYHNTILSPATWTFKKKEIESYYAIKDDHLLISKIKEWRDNYRLPRYMLLPDADNELYIDWENPIDIRSLFSIIKNRTSVVFNEFIFEPENAVIRDKEGKPYLNECIVSFYKNTEK